MSTLPPCSSLAPAITGINKETLCSALKGASASPIAVRTLPGYKATHKIPCGLNSRWRSLVAMSSAHWKEWKMKICNAPYYIERRPSYHLWATTKMTRTHNRCPNLRKFCLIYEHFVTPYLIETAAEKIIFIATQIVKSMGPAWDPPWSCRPQMGPMLAPWTLLSGNIGSIKMSPKADQLDSSSHDSCCWAVFNVHDDVIKWKHFPRYWPFVRGIPHTQASDVELWCFLWSAPE